MFTKSEEYLDLALILDDDISTAILRETGEIFLLLYLAVSLKLSLNYKWRYKSTLYHRMHCTRLN